MILLLNNNTVYCLYVVLIPTIKLSRNKLKYLLILQVLAKPIVNRHFLCYLSVEYITILSCVNGIFYFLIKTIYKKHHCHFLNTNHFSKIINNFKPFDLFEKHCKIVSFSLFMHSFFTLINLSSQKVYSKGTHFLNVPFLHSAFISIVSLLVLNFNVNI